MVLMQAMAYRKPVIITYTATVAEYVSEGSGVLLVPMVDGRELVRAIDRLSKNPGLARVLASRAYATYLARFSMEAFMERVCRVLEASSSESQDVTVTAGGAR